MKDTNGAAKTVIVVLGLILVLMVAASVLAPFLKVTMPSEVSESMDAVIVGLLAMLARTGSETGDTVKTPEGEATLTKEVKK